MADRSTELRGTLYLVPSPLDFGCEEQVALDQLLPAATLQTAARLQYWICESAKSTRAYLKRVNALYPLALAVQGLHIEELPRELHKHGDHGSSFDAAPLLRHALAGHDVGLVSDAGMPAVADPGSSVVRAAYRLGLNVMPLVGPSSLLLAAAASGLNGQSFAFTGYLPREAPARDARIREFEAVVLRTGQTQIFIETPYRNAAVLTALLDLLGPATRLAICAGASLSNAFHFSTSVAEWRARPPAGLALAAKLPAVYCIGK